MSINFEVRQAGRGGVQLRCRQAGFTLIELMITITIASVLMALAISKLQTPKTSSESNSLLNMLQLARAAAVKQGQVVIVCPSANPTAAAPTCSTSANWATGWIVLAPASPPASPCTATGGAAGDLVLQTQQALTSGDTANFTTTGANTAFCFTRYGLAYAAYTGIVQFDTSPANLARRRCLAVSGVGHMQVLTHGQSDALGVACP
ncbi:MAG: GspH/FimT family pseudopilin [Burkholderiaceae bacterium]|nr:GspH/FimT family pseudopilin [Burkholderiaceae bacterium]